MLDQSFPRNDAVLETVGRALGNLELALEANQAIVVLSHTLQMFIEDFDWQRTGPYPLLQVIHSLLVQWFLQPHSGLLVLDLDDIEVTQPHPVPIDCGQDGNVVLWAEDVARLLVLHDACAQSGRFFLGIACHNAFGGEPLGAYDALFVATRRFPLVGPSELTNLEDAYNWDIDANLHNQEVSFEDAKKNVPTLGGRVHNPTNGSHYKVTFAHASRPWPLDYNEDPLKDDFIKQLVPITNYPFDVIKTVLLTGVFPTKSLKLIGVCFHNQPSI
jgi:hypothetical protein